MKNLKSVSALAAALLSTTVFAGGLGLGVGANVDVGAGVGGLGVQSGISQQTDAQVGSGQLGAAVRQSMGIHGDAGIDQRTVSEGATAASARASVASQAAASQNRANADARSTARVDAGANVDADFAAGVRQTARHMQAGSHDAIMTARQSARARRAEAREQRVRSAAGVSGSAQLQSNTAGRLSTRASIKQAADLYTGG